MSSNQIQPASEMNEADDLRAFQGIEFSDDQCRICGNHLAIRGVGICTICIHTADNQTADLETDAELQDALTGLGSSLVW